MAARLVVGLVLVVALVAGAWVWLEGEGAPDPSPETAEAVLAAPAGADNSTSDLSAAPGGPAAPLGTDALLPDASATAVGAASAEPGTDDRPRVTLVGRLVSPQGRPVPAARVSLMTGPPAPMQLMARAQAAAELGDEAGLHDDLGEGASDSDDDGHFRVEAPLPEPDDGGDAAPAFLDALTGAGARLLVRHPGFRSAEHELPPLREGLVDVGTLVLDPAALIVGRVLAADRRPLAGARVAIQRNEQDGVGLGAVFGQLMGSPDEALSLGFTGADGRFRLTGLPPGPAALVVASGAAPLLRTDEFVLEVGLTTDAGDLQLAAGASLAGVVVDPEGRPLAGVPVRAAPSDGGLQNASARLLVGHVERRTHSADDGSFVLAGLDERAHDLKAGGGRFGKTSRDGVLPGRRDLRLEVSLLGELLLTVVDDASGEPVPDATVRAWRGDERAYSLDVLCCEALQDAARAGDDALSGEPLPADARGRHLIRGAGREGAELEVTAPGHGLTLVAAPPVSGPQRVALEIGLRPEAVLAGVVVDDLGVPVAGATVTAVQAGEAGERRSGTVQVRTVVLRDEQGRELERESNALELDTASDAAGAFRLGGLGAGPWELSVEAAEHLPPAPLELQLVSGEQRDDLRLVLTVGGSVAGTVREADGRPAAGVRVSVDAVREAARGGSVEEALAAQFGQQLVRSLGLPGDGDRQVKTDGEGRYRVGGLAPGPYSVSLADAGPRPVTLDLGALLGGTPAAPEQTPGVRVEVQARQTATVDLARDARASLEVLVLADGRPAPGARVSVRASSTSDGGLFTLDLGLGGTLRRTDDRGRLLLDDLAVGSHDVAAAVDGAPQLQRDTIELLAGERATLTLSFSGTTLRGRVVDAQSGAPLPGVVVSVSEHAVADDEADDEGGGGFLGGLLSGGKTSFSFSTTVNGVHSSGSGSGAGALGGLTAARVVSDGQGRFALPYLDTGSWVVSAGDGPWLPTVSEPVTVEPGVTPAELSLAVRRGGSLSGQLIEGTTEDPLDGIEIRLEALDDGGDFRDSADSERGSYRFEGLPDGRYVLLVGNGGDRCRREVQVREGEHQTVHLVTLD